MLAPLDIPIDAAPTTRRANRRVVAIAGAILVGTIGGFLAWRLPFVRASTLAFRPENTEVSMRFLHTASNVTDFNEHFSAILPLEGLPLSLPQLLDLSNYEGTLHLSSEGTFSYTFDATLEAEQKTAFEHLGFSIQEWKGNTLITKEPSGTTSAALTIGAFSPWHDGEVVVYGDHTAKAPIVMGNKGLTIGVLTTSGAGNPIRVPTESTVIMAGSIADDYFSYPLVAAGLQPLISSKLLTGIVNDGASLAVFNDQEGTGYFLSTSGKDLSVEDVAGIGQDIMNRTILSTRDWTSEDGETYQELRSSSENVATDIRAEEGFTFITLSNGEETVRLTKTDNILTVSNREIAISETVEPQSSCLSHALYWANTSLYFTEIDHAVAIDDLTRSLLQSFSEIAVNSHKIRLCW